MGQGDRSLASTILAALPETSSRLREAVAKHYSHTLGDARGIADWLASVRMRDPVLRDQIEDRGADRLVTPIVEAPGVDAWPPADCGLIRAAQILGSVVRRHWGRGPHRYHWASAGARRRFAREWRALCTVFEAAVEDVWIPLALDAISRALILPVWRHEGLCVVGDVPDGELARGAYQPVSPAAYRRVEQWQRRVAAAFEEARARILRLRAEDVRAYGVSRGYRDPRLVVHRPSSLLQVAQWIDRGRPEGEPFEASGYVPGLFDAVDRDPELVAHGDALRAALAERG